MLFTIASAIAFSEITSSLKRRSSLSADDKNFINKFELKALVVLSLSMHVILIGIGYAKYKKGKAWVHHLAWISYHVGDWVATVSLTTLFKCQKEEINAVEVFWVPFLLLHLGSAETLAANFVDEGELWIRYFVGLFLQSAIAFYVYWKLQKGPAAFNYIANLIFIAGIIKCGERIWILKSSSFNQLRKSVLSASPPQSFTSLIEDDKIHMPKPKKLEDYLIHKNIIQEGRCLHGAYLSFKMFLPLFSDLKLGIYKRLSYIFKLENMGADEAFKMIGIELGFLFDVLYTKTTLRSSVLGLILRSIFLLFSVLAFIVFSLIVNKHPYSCIDITITYLLLFGAIFADIFALSSHIFSKWTVRRLTKSSKYTKLPKCFNKAVSSWLEYRKGRKGIKYMAQYSLLKHSLMAKVSKFTAAMKIIGIATVLENFQYVEKVAVDLELKDFIFSRINKKRQQYEEEHFELISLFRLMDNGAYEFLKSEKVDAELGWSLKEVEFTHSILLWHIATDILYYDYRQRYPSFHSDQSCRISKLLSDYMMHLLAKRPFMLPKGIGGLRYRDTLSEAMKLLRQETRIESAAAALLGIDVQCRVFMRGGGKSVFFGACRLARELQSLLQKDECQVEAELRYKKLWERVKIVWGEILISAAYHCNWKEHVQQLAHGKELLTHITMLMAHLGLSKHIRMKELPLELDQLEDYYPPWDWENLNQLAYYLA